MAPLREANVLARYLVGADSSEEEAGRWARAVEALGKPMDRTTQTLWNFALRHPRLMGLFDVGLAFRDPKNPARQRIYIMLAILEASPNNVEFFLRSNRPAKFFEIFAIGCRALARAVAGALLVAGIFMALRFHEA